LKSEFISTAAHELRTPLTSIQGFSEILKIRDDLDDEKRKRFLTYINKQAVNLGNIISDLLDISRIESGMGFSLKKKKCKISDCILRVFSIYKISHPNHSFYFYLPDKETEVFVDIVKMEQVTENILSNAVKYSPYGGEIRIKGKILENKYMVSVEDKGIGMTPKQVEKIFEKFFRGDSSDTATEGTGLGMSIVKHIIEDHKGKIWVESKLGKGTKICFTIPMRLKRMIKRRSKIIENE
jgi:signal transduction histidine kinase